jgi:hypothetical protein
MGSDKTTLKLQDVDTSLIEFSSFKKGSFANASYNGSIFRVTLPKLKIPFNIKSYNGALTFEVSLNDKIVNKLKELDTFIVQFMYDKRSEWKGTDFTLEDLVTKQYSPVVKESSSGNYPPYMRIKIAKDYNGRINSDFFSAEKDEHGKYIRIDIGNNPEDYLTNLLQRNTEVQTAIDCAGLWVREGKFGITWKLVEMKVYPKPQITILEKQSTESSYKGGCCLFESDSEVSDEEILCE